MTRKRFSRICRAARFKESFIKELVKAIQDNGCSYAETFCFLKPVIAETCFLHNIPAPKELRPYVIGCDVGYEIVELTYTEVEEKDNETYEVLKGE